MTSEPQKIRTFCNECGGERNHLVRAEYQTRYKREGWDPTLDQYLTIECMGCDYVSFLKRSLHDDDIEYGQGPEGEKIVVAELWQEEIHPAPSYRVEPDWFYDLADEVLMEIMLQIYRALCVGSNFLAAVGTRTALDRIIVLKVGDSGNFKRGLTKLKDDGVISNHEHEILEVVVEAGHAAAHRGHAPSDEEMGTILDTVEHLMHRLFILERDAKRLKKTTPSRLISSSKPKSVIGRKKPTPTRYLRELGLPAGEALTFSKDPSITASIHDDRRILFRGEVTSLSRAALTVLREMGYDWNTVNGWAYWCYKGQPIASLPSSESV